MLAGEQVEQQTSGLSKRDWDDFIHVIDSPR
jgi:hypothetical protein